MLLAQRRGRPGCHLGTRFRFVVDRFGVSPMLNESIDVGLALGGIATEARQLALLAGERLPAYGQLIEAAALFLCLGLLAHEALAQLAD